MSEVRSQCEQIFKGRSFPDYLRAATQPGARLEHQPIQFCFLLHRWGAVPDGRAAAAAAAADVGAGRDLDERPAVDRVRRLVPFPERPYVVPGGHAHSRTATATKL